MYHSFVDESKNNSYLLVAALIRPAHLTRTRQLISGMVVPGQRRIHFHKESDGRRSKIMGRLAEMPIEAIVYEVRGKVHENVARSRCLTSLIRDQLARDTRRLVIESDESRVEADRRILRREILRADALDQVVYEHARPYEEPLLAIPDAIGWCWFKGEHWRVKAKGLVTEVFQA